MIRIMVLQLLARQYVAASLRLMAQVLGLGQVKRIAGQGGNPMGVPAVMDTAAEFIRVRL